MLQQAQHLLPPFIFLLLRTVDVAIRFTPHPSSPKYEKLKSECGFRVYIVGFGGGAR
jgi:hypothetical protein